MSMPEFPKPNPDLTQEQALTMILSSIALEEVALSHILNAEGEKIQHILKHVDCHSDSHIKDILAVNKSVTGLLEMVLQNQMILKNKMESVLEFLPKPSPNLPSPPDPPKPPCCRQTECRSEHRCFPVMPGFYACGQALRWCGSSAACLELAPGDCTKIQMPRSGPVVIDLCLDKPGYSLNYQNPVRTGYIVRRLTPTECERLQGYPDGWTAFDEQGKPISDTKRYQMLGNSVAVPCVAYILQSMARQLTLPLGKEDA